MKKNKDSESFSTVSVVLKLLIFLCSTVGVSIDASDSGARVLLYFTIQSNLWIGITSLVLAVRILRHQPVSAALHRVKLMFTMAILLTGGVFCFLLAPVDGLSFTLANILTHVAVPLLSLLDYLLFDTAYAYEWKDAFWSLIPPVYYILFAAVGYVQNWDFTQNNHRNYPYFFLNWGSPCGVFGFSSEPPFMGTGCWILVMFVIMTGFSCILIGCSKLRHLKG